MTANDDKPDPPAGEGAALPWDRAVAWLRGHRPDDPDPERTLLEACQDEVVTVLPGARTLPTEAWS